MKVSINGKDASDILKDFQGERVRIEIKSFDREHIVVMAGTVKSETERIEPPYNPLTDMDCGTDAMIGRVRTCDL